jgi:general secretion pathway protein G
MGQRVPAGDRRSDAGFSMVELLVVLVFIGIIAAIAINLAFYAFDSSRLGKTMGNMRGLADALTKYQSDTSSLPGGGLQPVSAIAPLLHQSAGNIIPMKDGWEHDLYYEPLSTAGGGLSFRVYSYGKDGTSDGVVTGTWVDFYTDTVVEGGSFIQAKW